MPCEFCDDPDDKYVGIYLGEVVDNKDPEGVGRVRVKIPIIAEGEDDDEGGTDWADPIGTMGGGTDRRGLFFVPEIGSTVAVAFEAGDITRPMYWSGPWGKPEGAEGGSEVPDTVKDTPEEDRPKITALETEHFAFIIDNREDNEVLIIKHKGPLVDPDGQPIVGADRSQNYIEIDGANFGITIKAEAAIVIDAAQVDIRGSRLSLNGRTVMATKKPI